MERESLVNSGYTFCGLTQAYARLEYAHNIVEKRSTGYPKSSAGIYCTVVIVMGCPKIGGPKLVMFNTVSRNIPRGLHIGMDNKALVLQVSEGFDVINHYGVPCQLHRIEIWGCGGDEAKQAQVSQKQWEAKDIEREKMRKLRLEGDWRENPDLQLLEWGGVKTGSSYTANR